MNMYLAGVIGGLVGGLVFGKMMAMMMGEMLNMIAKLWGGSTRRFGWFVHLFNSAVIGLGFILVSSWLGWDVTTTASGLKYGLLYGFAWWIIGPLVVMPVWLGMPVQLWAPGGIKRALPSLWGHLVYGGLLGLVVAYLL